MADFARWVEAGAPAFGWKPGRFLAAYSLNRKEADQIALDMLPVGPAVQVFMEKRPEWEGEPSALLAALTAWAGEATKARSWPKAAHILSGQFKRLAPNLRRQGIEVQTGLRGEDGRRRIRLTSEAAKQRQQRQECQDPQHGADSH